MSSRMVHDPQDSLSYNAAYRVLICRECQYAIQKNAISSHLLRHKIYREDRQRLLARVAELDLLDPEDVVLPSPGSPAVEGLAVITGYCCTKRECGSLWASIKRMKRHQREVHEESDLANVNAFARPVRMQTFFRGTKLRYFEVTDVLAEDDAAVRLIETQRDNYEEDDSQDIEHQSVSMGYVSSGLSDRSPSQNRTSRSESAQSPAQAPGLNLEAMTYFRHYLTRTSGSLPAPFDQPQEWLTTVVDHALKHQWLAYGLLALSAYNMAMMPMYDDSRDAHTRNGNHYSSEFSNGFSLELVRQQILHGTDISAIGDRMHHLLMCAYRGASDYDPHGHRSEGQHTQSYVRLVVDTLQTFAQWSFVPRCDIPQQEAIFSRAKSILEFDHEEISALDPACFDLLHRLGRLPARLSDALGRPDRVQEVLATLAATSALVVSCEMSFASNSKEAAWHGMLTGLHWSYERKELVIGF
ncbi:hypothetical protein IQ06DRAFT_331763 [Phaeosphaeriaceae sp. SRC1lsM3a]|nr:hypothetical protein IQ06DRAFT_331763 [Stagonospora sp. SRC1lsM3a]